MRMYKLKWQKTGPYVAIGETYEVGKKQKQRRVREHGGKAGQDVNEWATSIGEAIDQHLVEIANAFCSFNPRRRTNPRMLMFVICELRRLQRRMESHGINTDAQSK